MIKLAFDFETYESVVMPDRYPCFGVVGVRPLTLKKVKKMSETVMRTEG